MYLDYSKLEFDADGIPETPELVLQTMSEKVIGIIPGVHNLKLNIKFSEPSEMSFDVPAVIDDEPNWIYDQLSGHKLIYTKHYGVYLLLNPTIESDGIAETKHIQAYSIEKTLDTKKFFLEEGTFKFYDQTNYMNGDTIMGHIFEIATGWKPGYVSPSIAQKYRTFDQYDDYLLSFIYNTAPEKFRCVFVFDPYEKTISVYNADKPLCNETVPGDEANSVLPIYLDFDNLLDAVDIEEKSEELVTAIRPHGADGLDIREVNPIGTDWIYDLSWFMRKDKDGKYIGDIPETLAIKWTEWQHTVLNNRERYRGLSAMRASATLSLLSAQAKLVDLNGELEALEAQQSTIIQAMAMKSAQQNQLDEVNIQIARKKSEISAQEDVVDSYNSSVNTVKAQIEAIVKELDIVNCFTPEEYKTLSAYFVEQDITEETFVATDLDTGISGQSYTLSNERVSISGSQITKIPLTDFDKTMYILTGGNFSFSGSHPITGDIIRGTLETKPDGNYVLSIYAGSIRVSGTSSPSGCITMSGVMSGFSNNAKPVTIDGITTYEGSSLSFSSESGSLYLTANVSEYKKYSVGLELYDYAVDVLKDLATPTYEFSVDSGNFIFADEFAPFRDRLELGRGVYLRLNHRDEPITPYIIEFELEFEDRSAFSIIFSNRFKRPDEVNTLKDMIEKSYSSGRSFDASKYIYNQVSNQQAAVTEFMNSSLDAAKNTILAASNLSVILSGSGINVGGKDKKYQIRIVDKMIAMTDDNWEHAKVGIGLFKADGIGEYWGVNAEVIGGRLIVGNNLIVENVNDDGVMQFKVDASGAWLNNSTFVLQKDNGGKIIIDPKYGIVAGNGNLYTTNGTTVTPSFINSSGAIDKDTDGMPKNSNFYLDIRDGSAYFRGTVKAGAGSVGGWTIHEDFLHASSGGNYVAMNASGTNSYSSFAFWAGAENPNSAPFWVKKDGSMKATKAQITGTLTASRISGALTAENGGEIIGPAIYVPTKSSPKFKVDSGGNVTMSGNINMTGNITWGSGNSPCQALYCTIYRSPPVGSYASYPTRGSSNWHRTLVYDDLYASYTYDGGATWTSAIKIRGEDGRDGLDGIDGSDATVNERNVFDVLTNGGTKFGIFNDSTSNRLYINANYIRAGTIDADLITLGSDWGGFCCARGSDGVSVTYGSMMYGSDPDYYFIATNKGVRMQAPDNGLTITNGGLYASEEISTGSDRRIKNSISYDMSRYADFFTSLKPSYYRLNSGKSGRFHIGFIAQDVERAIVSSGLNTNDFAGLVRSSGANDVHDAYEDQYYLRYTDFIALNTFMIQRLNQRIEELESKINSMS